MTFNGAADPRAAHHHLSLACNHCAEAPCAVACPARAFNRDEAAGTLTLEADRCLGCRYCAWVCPFQAPLFDEAGGVMGKCTFCAERRSSGGEPACVHACPTGALTFGRHNEVAAETVSRPLLEGAAGFPRTSAGPSIRFRPRRAGATPPESTWQLEPEVLAAFDAARPAPAAAAGLGHEWPLLVFTLAASLVVALETAAFAGRGIASCWPALLAVAALAVSPLHLGRPRRAWRALLGLGSSWLSREIALFGALAVLIVLGVLSRPLGEALRPVAVAVGWATLFAVDRVYDVVRRPRALPVHSADTLLVAAFLSAILTGSQGLAVAIGALRLGCYTARKLALRREGRPTRAHLAAVRTIAGFGLPLVALWLEPPVAAVVAGVGLTLGELVDRAELYLELEPTTPRETAARDLAAAVARQNAIE